MTANLTFYDAAAPPAHHPSADGVAAYIGGDTPHVWSRTEISAAGTRYVLPVYVRSHPATANASHDAAEALARLRAIGAPRGCIVSWDTETAASPAYMAVVFHLITSAGYRLMDYGSASAVFGNRLPDDAYYWAADWTNKPHIYPGSAGTQYEDAGPYDLSEFPPGLPFWDTHTGLAAPVEGDPVRTIVNSNWQEKIMQQLPTIKQGATGIAVKTVQGLLCARTFPVKIDADFGPATAAAVRQLQGADHIAIDGIVGPATWAALLAVA